MKRSPLSVILAGLALIAFAIYMESTAGLPPISDDAPLQPAILYFELAENRAEVEQALTPADPDYRFEGETAADCVPGPVCMRRRADLVNTLDAGLLILYPLYFLTIFAWLRGDSGTIFLIGLMTVPIMVIGDVLENARLFELTALLDQADAGIQGLDPIFERVVQHLQQYTRLKWGAIFAACLAVGALYSRRIFAGDGTAVVSGAVYRALDRWLPLIAAVVFVVTGAVGSFSLLPGERSALPSAFAGMFLGYLLVFVHAVTAALAERSRRKAG